MPLDKPGQWVYNNRVGKQLVPVTRPIKTVAERIVFLDFSCALLYYGERVTGNRENPRPRFFCYLSKRKEKTIWVNAVVVK